MERALLIIFIVAIVGAGIIAGGAGFFAGGFDSWSPREYVTINGECFVRPQGDPLYDAHYAEKVNMYNCEAYEMQENAQHTEADTRRIDWETMQSRLATYGFSIVVIMILAFFAYVAFRS
jgi:hypothetical protein